MILAQQVQRRAPVAAMQLQQPDSSLLRPCKMTKFIAQDTPSRLGRSPKSRSCGDGNPVCDASTRHKGSWVRYPSTSPHPRPVMLRVLVGALEIPNKIERLAGNAAIFEGEEAIPSGSQDDTYIVRLAVETGAILVTTDGPLRDDLRECGILETRNVTVVSPEDARTYL